MTPIPDTTAAEVSSQMPRTSDYKGAAVPAGHTAAQGGAMVGRRALKQLGENPLLAVFGAALVALLIFSLNSTNDRITRLEDRMDARFTALEARFTALEEDVSEIDLKLADLDRKLTAVIAALNMTEEVTAAIEGRIGDPAAE